MLTPVIYYTGTQLTESLAGPYRAIFDQAAVGIAHIALDGQMTRANQKLCEILGFTGDELLIRKFVDITHPDDRAASQEFLRNAKTRGTLPASPLCEKRYVRKDGSVMWASVSVSLVLGEPPESDYLVAMVYDISGRKSTEEHFRATFEQAAVGIAHSTIDRHYFLVNQKFCDTLGYSQAELLKMRSSDITHPDDLADDAVNMKDILEGRINNVTGEKRFIRKDGSEVWVNRSLSLVRDPKAWQRHAAMVVPAVEAGPGRAQGAWKPSLSVRRKATMSSISGGVRAGPAPGARLNGGLTRSMLPW